MRFAGHNATINYYINILTFKFTLNNSLELSQNEDINLRLRTLNLIRWIAVLGQFSAVVIAFFYFQIVFNIYICILLILLSVTLNIAVSVLYPLTKILNYNETFFYLV